MQLVSIKAIVAMLWVSTVSIAGSLNSFPSWAVLAALALTPPLVMLSQWNDPRQTMSETIQEALR